MKKAGKSGIGSARAGFTLVELMVATTILLIFGGMAVTALRYGSSLWRSGHRRGYSYDAATAVFHQLEDDIRAAKSQFWNQDADAYDPRIRFIVDYDDHDLGRQRLRFVRGIPDDTVNPRIRQAGDGVDNDEDGFTDEEYYDLMDGDEDLMPLEGMCEVAYMMGRDGNGLTTLYRAVLAPIGGPNTLFDEANIDDDDAVVAQQLIEAVALPLAQNVLHFEVRLWTQYTTTWRPLGFYVWPSSYEPHECGPSFTWDSDRLSDGADFLPDFVMDWGQPGFLDPDGWRRSTPEYVVDNVFPRAVMVVIAVQPPARLLRPDALVLAEDISSTADSIPVIGELPNYNKSWPYIRIGDEWIRFESFNPQTQQFIVPSAWRGMRGTSPAEHDAGDPVL
ncbi:MAG: prepilin-type N-terminal cleavage/methylation domain-containing protein, partial [Candidatus Brocadiae bacterium]|nr:prepilin-type N-terminal cleavage/methylation domain-containing protein [Candidatus Brocadiia bacterium]